MNINKLFILCFVFIGCDSIENHTNKIAFTSKPSIIVLGNVQDGGSPHIGCKKKCCKDLFTNPDKNRMVTSLGLIDPIEKKSWIIEASPDYPRQAKILSDYCKYNENPNGIFLTHAHIGHYAGLMYLGKESLNASNIPVFAMTRMKGFLIQNGPWSQLVNLKNIKLNNIDHLQNSTLSTNISITPFLVPHRDEFSETVGYKITGPSKTVLFIPDIDKWSKWNKSIIDEIKNVDIAFIDATFYDKNEINNRHISEIPHPFVIETMDLFKEFSLLEKQKIHFIHMNHSNPLLDSSSNESKFVLSKGFNIARAFQIIEL
ncbi:MAG: MBL fold metallo-hydrolase [Flavobacteriales bacterium]|nr:MBL fold metallo-hydrolase [Flavobacteriales bacterium]